ncbi:putative ribonuclease H protein [Vitis vinifera]|uniref:Biogenesis of lysosome-related organelles complex 1 subunit 7 n=1 Tax=Vitis vinifera TaxID=29760 RepID=A0A438H1H5_VITVI|nr:putative ribonuclease H protein [Vitis vinifera]
MPIYHMSLFRMPKSVARRLDKVQRDFLWGGGSVERKAYLIKWEAICEDKSKGGLGLRKLVLLNKALLGKWIWRFAYDKDNLWKQVITAKYGQEGHGWRAKRAHGAFGVGVWKEIWKETDWLSQNFPHLFAMASHRNATVEEMWDQNFGQGGWNLRFLRDFNDWEMDIIGNLLHVLRDYKPFMEEDSVCWKGGRNGKFRVKEAYRLVARPNDIVFPSRCIWVDSVPTKVAFYAWEATWGGCSLLIDFRKENDSFLIVVFYVVVKKKLCAVGLSRNCKGELDKLLEDAPLPFIMQHAAKISGVRKRVSSLNSLLKSIQRRVDNIDGMLSMGLAHVCN